jgi:hypothetical protein
MLVFAHVNMSTHACVSPHKHKYACICLRKHVLVHTISAPKHHACIPQVVQRASRHLHLIKEMEAVNQEAGGDESIRRYWNVEHWQNRFEAGHSNEEREEAVEQAREHLRDLRRNA